LRTALTEANSTMILLLTVTNHYWRASEVSKTLSGVYKFEICDMFIYILYGLM